MKAPFTFSLTFSCPHTDTNTHTHTPLIVGDVQVLVDGEERLFEEDDPLALLLLRLVKDGLHLLHVARSVAVHLLQDFLIASANLNTEMSVMLSDMRWDSVCYWADGFRRTRANRQTTKTESKSNVLMKFK